MVFAVTIGGITISLETIGAAITALGTGLITLGKLIEAQKKKEEEENDENQLCHKDQDSDSCKERIDHREK